ncbi:MAG: hypothetical protein GY807_05795 [Gammaproteobacteria bacterium]|nr:hypothetical protein [Gammaproteobacteria bacterium]
MYAYNYHAPPPGLHVHNEVVVSVATSFIKGGWTLDKIINGWSKQGGKLGIREYYSVFPWDHDMPGKARASDIDYLKQTIPDFHRQGARFYSAEAGDNWGPNGLGYYLASRALWDVDEAKQFDLLIEDFLSRSFGTAKKPMREFYRQLDGSKSHLMLEDQLVRMFLTLAEARRLSEEAEVNGRINDLVLYTWYVHLFLRYSKAKGEPRQMAFEKLIRHAYRMRRTMMVHVKALYRDLSSRDKSISIPPGAGWEAPEAVNPWKDSMPFTETELTAFVRQGIATYTLIEPGFDFVDYDTDLVLANSLGFPKLDCGNIGAGRGIQNFYTYVESPGDKIELRLSGGLIPHYRDRGNVRVELRKVSKNGHTDRDDDLIDSDLTVPPDGSEHRVILEAAEPGLYRITVLDGGDKTLVNWSEETPVTMKAGLDDPVNIEGEWSLYFYVPKGSKVIGGFSKVSRGTIISPDDGEKFALDVSKSGFFSFPVPIGSDGKLWKIERAVGDIRLLTVPPYLAKTSRELLLPRSTVKRDAE